MCTQLLRDERQSRLCVLDRALEDFLAILCSTSADTILATAVRPTDVHQRGLPGGAFSTSPPCGHKVSVVSNTGMQIAAKPCCAVVCPLHCVLSDRSHIYVTQCLIEYAAVTLPPVLLLQEHHYTFRQDTQHSSAGHTGFSQAIQISKMGLTSACSTRYCAASGTSVRMAPILAIY